MTNIKTLVVDASVVVKWVVGEEGTDHALSLFRFRLTAPDLLLAECGNVLWRKQRRRELTAEEVDKAVAQLIAADVTLFSSRPVMHQALGFASALNHPIYDCLYLALAQSLACPMVTADEKLCNKLPPSFPAHVVRLRDSDAAFA